MGRHVCGAERRRRQKQKAAAKERADVPTIYMFVSHHSAEPKVEHALYKIQLPLDISDYDNMIDSDGFMTDSKNISPVLTFSEANFLPHCTSVTLGSKIYYFGGTLFSAVGTTVSKTVRDSNLKCKVQVFDTQHPEQGMRTVAPLNFPKHKPCLFVAHDMIYSLGSYMYNHGPPTSLFPGWKGTGHFERYDPSLDQWQVLPDPPLPFHLWWNADFRDSATVVDHLVFIGAPYLLAIFNLDVLEWETITPALRDHRHFCASIFVQDSDSDSSGSFYYLRHPQTDLDPKLKTGTVFKRDLVFRTPTGTTEQSDCGRRNLLKCLDFDKQDQVVAEDTDLEDAFCSHYDFIAHRKLFHLGGRFFCYVVSSLLIDHVEHAVYDPHSRGVWIRILEAPTKTETGTGTETETGTGTETDNGGKSNSNIKFRFFASFFYKIDTDFPAWARHIRFSVIGTVPDSWTKVPLEERLSIKLKLKNEYQVEVAKLKKKLITVEEEKRQLLAKLANLKMQLNKP